MSKPTAIRMDTGAPSHRAYLVLDSVMSAQRALPHLKAHDPKCVEEANRLAEIAQRDSVGVVDVLVREQAHPPTQLTASLVAGWCASVLVKGQITGMASNSLLVIEHLWQGRSSENRLPGDRLMSAVFAALNALTFVAAESGEMETSEIRDICVEFAALAHAVEGADDVASALSCAQAAANWAALLPAQEAVAYADKTLAFARKFTDPASISMELTRRAHYLCRAADASLELRVAAFDAVETVLRYFQLDNSSRPQPDVAHTIGMWVFQQEYLSGLRPLAICVFPDQVSVTLPDTGRRAIEQLVPVFAGSLSEWRSRMQTFIALAIEIENRRLALLPPLPAIQAEAFWSTTSFSHPRLLRAVPSSRSILKERNFDDLILEISHEVTHILSMTGRLGMAFSALRWVQFEWELDLLARLNPDLADLPPSAALAHLKADRHGEAGAVHLAMAERILVLQRKIQILQQTWAPWFEGIAIFGELHANPTDNTESYTPLTGILTNLQDRFVGEFARERDIQPEEAFAALWQEAEHLASDTQHHVGSLRLRTYLGATYGPIYMAGYLAVRAVVASWRSRLPGVLTGNDAFTVLLHATRYTHLPDMLPDLALPLDEFAQSAVRRMADWVATSMKAAPTDIQASVANYNRADDSPYYEWQQGRLVAVESPKAHTDLVDHQLAALMDRVQDPSAMPDLASRAPGANENCLEVMDMIEEIYAKRGPLRIFPRTFATETVARGKSVLALAQCECPFWLIPTEGWVVLLLRTCMESREDGKPAYGGITVRVGPDKLKTLEAELRRGGPSRVKVTRVTEMVGPEPMINGANYIVLQYGDWEFVQPAGLLLGAQHTPESAHTAIRDRLSPSPLVQAFERTTGEDLASAQSTLEWTSWPIWQVEEHGVPLDLRPWADAVNRLAQVVLSADNSTTDCANDALLQVAVPDTTVAARLKTDGFKAAFDAAVFTDLIHALNDSGRRALPDDGKLDALNQKLLSIGLPLLKRHLHGWDTLSPVTNHQSQP